MSLDRLLGRVLYWFDDHPFAWTCAAALLGAAVVGVALLIAWLA